MLQVCHLPQCGGSEEIAPKSYARVLVFQSRPADHYTMWLTPCCVCIWQCNNYWPIDQLKEKRILYVLYFTEYLDHCTHTSLKIFNPRHLGASLFLDWTRINAFTCSSMTTWRCPDPPRSSIRSLFLFKSMAPLYTKVPFVTPWPSVMGGPLPTSLLTILPSRRLMTGYRSVSDLWLMVGAWSHCVHMYSYS